MPVGGAPVTPVDQNGNVIGGTGAGSVGTSVQGNVASGATDSGNPVKIAGVFNTTLPTLTTGQRGDVQLDGNGNVRSVLISNSSTAIDGQINTLGFARSPNSQVGGGNVLLAQASYNFNGTTWDRSRGDTTGTYVVSKGTPTIATGQVASSISPATSIQVVAARAGRQSVVISNITGTQPVYFTATAVATGATTGFFLAGVAGASITIPTSAAIFATSPTAAQTLSFMENY